MNDYRRAVNTLNLPEERDAALARATETILKQIEIIETVEELAATFDDKTYLNDILKADIKKTLHKGALLELDIVELEEATDIEDYLFDLKRKLLNKLTLAEGEVIASKDTIKINGLVRVDSDEFTKETLAQTTFG